MRWTTVLLVVLISPLSVLAQSYTLNRDVSLADAGFLKKKYVDLKVLLRGSTTDNPKTYFEARGSQFYYEKSRRSIFYRIRKDEPVIITDIKPNGDSFEVYYVSSTLGKGLIWFSSHIYSPKIDFRAFEYGFRLCFTPSDGMEFPPIHNLSEEPPAGEQPPFVGNSLSGVFHVVGSNHLPDLEYRQTFNSENEAETAGMKQCRLCFLQRPNISEYELEHRLGLYVAGEVKMHSQLVVNQELQEKTEEIGRRVLRNWPVPIQGYDYHFYLLEDYEFNAYAAPTGYIFVNRGLMEIAESELEIESVLAHEIAHVERRHGYRIYRKALKRSRIAAGIGLLFSATIGMITKDKDDALIMGGLSAAFSQLVMNAFYAGFPRSMEEEADAMASLYLNLTYGERGVKAMTVALRKLQYYDDYNGRNTKDLPAYSSHPHLSDRIATFSRSDVQLFDNPITITGMDQDGQTSVTIKLIAQQFTDSPIGSPALLEPFQFLGHISATATINKPRKFKDLTITTTDGKIIKLDNKEDSLVAPYEEEGFLLRANFPLLNKVLDTVSVNLEGTNFKWEVHSDGSKAATPR